MFVRHWQNLKTLTTTSNEQCNTQSETETETLVQMWWMLAAEQVLVLGILSSSEQTTHETVVIQTDGLPLQVTVTTHYIACGL